MYIVILISLISFFFAILSSKGKMKGGLKYCFILLTILCAIHYDYGSDYMVYVAMFDDSKMLSLSWESIADYFRDPGWITLCVLFRPLGFFALVIALNILQNFIFYHIIDKYVPRNWQWFSVFIYVFSTSFYLLNFSMMRQGLAIALLFWAVFLIIEKKHWKAIILILASFTIHGTSMITIPFLIVLLFMKDGKRVLSAYAFLFILLLFLYRPVYSMLMSITVNDTLTEYGEMYKRGNGISLGIGFVIEVVTLIVLLYISVIKKSLSHNETRLLTFYLVTFLLLPFQMENQMVGRIGYYFNVMSIVMVPLAYSNINNEKGARTFLIGLFVAITLYRYWFFFTAGTFVTSYAKPFQTIFSVPWM